MDEIPLTVPILEFDPAPEAIIEPSRVIKPRDVPEHAVLCFFQEAIERICGEGKGQVIGKFKWEDTAHLVYEISVSGRRLAVMHPGIGAPMAAGLLEDIIALGCRKFIVCGGAGVLDKNIAVGHLLVPMTAVRDEGTSYHYLPPAREVGASPEGVAAIERALQSQQVDYLLCKTWTTDGVYRETPRQVARRKLEGCLTVEMEAAALFAVAQFRHVILAQILYGGDDVSGTIWDQRSWNTRAEIRERLFWLAADACLNL